MVNVRDYIKRSGKLVKIILVIIAFVLFAVISFLIIQSGYAIVAIIGAGSVGLLIGFFFLFKEYRRFDYIDLMHASFLKLYRGTRIGTLPYEVPLYVKQSENATIKAFCGYVQGRTMLPYDPKLLEHMGEKSKHKRKAVTDKNKLKEICEDNSIWCFRVKKPNMGIGTKEKLVIIADSQISDLSRDATGDIQAGTPILAYGHWLEVGEFSVLWNTGKVLERAVLGIQTVAILSLLENQTNRLGQLARMDAKTRPEIVEKQEINKSEADVLQHGE